MADEEKKWTLGNPLLSRFVIAFGGVSAAIHQWAKRKKHWEAGKDRNLGEQIALIHSELSEALEAYRNGNPPDEHCPDFSSIEVEFADCVIRIMDTGAAYGFHLASAMIAKMAFNETRPEKHEKKF